MKEELEDKVFTDKKTEYRSPSIEDFLAQFDLKEKVKNAIDDKKARVARSDDTR